jgi:hypothetical protein
MKAYEITIKNETSRLRDRIPDSQWIDDYRLMYQRKQEYIEHEGKLAYVVIDSIETITTKVEAISEDAIRKAYTDRVIDYHGEKKRVSYDLEIKFIKELDTSPFEMLNPDYCKTANTPIRTESVDVGESILVLENQGGFDKMTKEEKHTYLNENVYTEDTHTYLGY